MRSKFLKTKRRGGFYKLNKKISLKSQIKRIAETFPNAEFNNKDGNSFEVLIKLQPTPLSKFYDIKINYSIIKGIEIYVINEKLQIAERRNSLPHVYSTKSKNSVYLLMQITNGMIQCL